jgi:hypothetical protein
MFQRLPFSSAYYSLATTILQASTILQRLPFSSATIFQRLPFPSAYHFPAPTFLQCYYSLATTIRQSVLYTNWFQARIHLSLLKCLERVRNEKSMHEMSKDGQFLCLWCLSIGHQTSKCRPEPRKDIARGSLHVLATVKDDAPLCDRCYEMWPHLVDLLSTSTPSRGDEGLIERDAYNLGAITDAVFHSNCPLCRLIFITVGPTSSKDWNESIVLYQSWSPESLGFQNPDTVTAYAGCLTARYERCQLRGRFGTGAWNPNGNERETRIAIISGCSSRMLGGKMVNLAKFDVDVVKTWIGRCELLHTTACAIKWQEELRQIRLVNVHTRTIVQYPEQGQVDYVALTYVWGVSSQRERYRFGSVVKECPKTIEDAIHITKDLGKDFLWVDSLCIDQSDVIDKEKQIRIMAPIYSGAWVTLVALVGDDADSGLPRAGTDSNDVSDNETSQWGCTFGDTTLLTIPPTLNQQISRSKWVTRGWTLQEAVLSPRCLYFAEEQAYYECNILQACESLDDSNSLLHSAGELELVPKLLEDPRGNFMSPFLDATTLRVSDIKEYGSRAYEKLLELYTARTLSLDADALNAFSAILDRLEKMSLRSGFIWGIPRHKFKSFLLWVRRGSRGLERRSTFPSWSWAGWKGYMKYYTTYLIGTQPYCQIYSIVDGQKALAQATPSEEYSLTLAEYTFTPDETTPVRATRSLGVDDLSVAEDKGLLLVDGVIFKLILVPGIRHTMCLDDGSEALVGEAYDCLLVGSRWYGTNSPNRSHVFLVLRWDKSIAYRAGLLQLSYAPHWGDNLPPGFWENCQPRLLSFFLA